MANLQIPSMQGLGQQPQVMIGVDQNLSAVVSDRILLSIAKDLYLDAGSEYKTFRDACDASLRFLDAFTASVKAWHEAKP